MTESTTETSLLLDSNWRIKTDDNNVTLEFFEQRERTKQDGTVEDYEYVDCYYYPTMKKAMIAYLQKALKPAKSIDVMVSLMTAAEKRITELFGKEASNGK